MQTFTEQFGCETELARRTLVSEQRRATILAWAVTGLFFAFTTTFASPL